jgi:PIN domain nuclease of toxin-antitoxin system
VNGEEGLILDTHIWIWWVDQDAKLSAGLAERIAQAPRIAISAASVYELVQTVARGRLALSLEVSAWLQAATVEAGIEVMAVDGRVAQLAAELPPVHGDPLDRFIIATALAAALPLISLDRKFAGYPSLAELLVRQ